MLGAGAAARTTPAITGTRPHATRAVDEDRSIQSSTGEEDEPPTKLKALPLEVEGRGGTAVTSGLPESRTVETSDIDVGDSSSPAPGTSGARPAAAAAGVSTPDLATSNGAPPTAAAENVALAALASIVANPVAMSVGPPQHDGTTGTLAIASPRPTAASDGGSPQPQFFGVSPIDVGTESGGSGLDASPPPPRLTVQPPVPEPPCTVSDGRFHQATSLTQHAYAVCPQQPAAAAFDAAVDPQAAPARGGVAGHLGTDGKSLSAAAAATAARPSDAALGHHPPLASLLPAGTASGGGGGGGGGGPPRPKRKRSGPAAGRRPERRKCGMEGCKRRPTFGVEGTRQAEFCLSHKHDGFVNVLAKRCDAVEGCRRQPSFGMPGAKPVRCAAHRLDGMVNLSAPRCVSPGCRVVPSFAPPGARRASTCSAHRRSGDVDIVTRRCHHEGCIHRPVFGDISAGKALYCSAHKLGGKDVFRPARGFVVVFASDVVVVVVVGCWLLLLLLL